MPVECDRAAPVPLEVALYQPSQRQRHTIDTTVTLRWAWDNLGRRAHIPVLYAPSIALAKNPQMPLLDDQGAVTWAKRMCILRFSDLYREEGFLGPPAPTDTPPPSFPDTLLCYRIRATCQKLHDTFPDPPPTLQALENILTTPSATKLKTQLYTSMQKHHPVIVPKYREQWNTELYPQVTEDEWNFCCAQLEQLSPNYKLRLIHFRFLNQYYRTPIQLRHMGLRPQAECWRCHSDQASFLHMAWSCP